MTAVRVRTRWFCGSIDHHPYTGDVPITPTSAAVLPVVNLQIIGDYWVHDLGPGQLAVIIGQLRAQADYLDHELRPALIAARADWIARPRTAPAAPTSPGDRGTPD